MGPLTSISPLTCVDACSPGWTRTSNLSGTGKFHYHRLLTLIENDQCCSSKVTTLACSG